MIRPLRKRHRVMIFALSALVPAAFALGIVTRREIPTLSADAAGLSHRSASRELWSRDDLWEKATIQTRLMNYSGKPGAFAIELKSKDKIVRPDILVYWVPQGSKVQDSLPGDAFLLGSFDQSVPAPLALPPHAATESGVLILYSLAEHELVAVSKPFSTR